MSNGGSLVVHPLTTEHEIKVSNPATCGLYYKRVTIVIDAPSVVSK